MVPEHDPKHDTMFAGLFVGHPDSEFDAVNKDPMLHIQAIRFRSFQLVMLFLLQPFRSHYTTEVGSNITFNPESGTERRKTALRALMQGKSADICVTQYHNVVWEMSRRVLRIELNEAKSPQAVAHFKECLRKIPKPISA
jgi:hypothetical protein